MRFISSASIIIPIILMVLTFKNIDRGMRFILLLFSIGLINEIITSSRILSIEQNHILFHIYTIFEVNIILIALLSWFKKNLFQMIMIVFNSVFIIYFIIFPISSIETYIEFFGSVCILIGIVIVSLNFTFSKGNQLGRVIVSISFALYFSVMIFLYVLSNQSEPIGQWSWKYIHSVINILLNIGVSYGILCQYNSNKLYNNLLPNNGIHNSISPNK